MGRFFKPADGAVVTHSGAVKSAYDDFKLVTEKYRML
jgi:hypothetical protein